MEKVTRIGNVILSLQSNHVTVPPVYAKERIFINRNGLPKQYTTTRNGFLVDGKKIYTQEGFVYQKDDLLEPVDFARTRPIITTFNRIPTFMDILEDILVEFIPSEKDLLEKVYSNKATLKDVFEGSQSVFLVPFEMTFSRYDEENYMVGKSSVLISISDAIGYSRGLKESLNYGILQLHNYMGVVKTLSSYFKSKRRLAQQNKFNFYYIHPRDYSYIKEDLHVLNGRGYYFYENRFSNTIYTIPIEDKEVLKVYKPRVAFSFGDDIILHDATTDKGAVVFAIYSHGKLKHEIGYFDEKGIDSSFGVLLDYPCAPHSADSVRTEKSSITYVVDDVKLTFQVKKKKLSPVGAAQKILDDYCDTFREFGSNGL